MSVKRTVLLLSSVLAAACASTSVTDTPEFPRSQVACIESIFVGNPPEELMTVPGDGGRVAAETREALRRELPNLEFPESPASADAVLAISPDPDAICSHCERPVAFRSWEAWLVKNEPGALPAPAIVLRGEVRVGYASTRQLVRQFVQFVRQQGVCRGAPN